jgi:hypothetical protein
VVLRHIDILPDPQFSIVAPGRARQFGPNGNVAIIDVESGADLIFGSVFDANFCRYICVIVGLYAYGGNDRSKC